MFHTELISGYILSPSDVQNLRGMSVKDPVKVICDIIGIIDGNVHETSLC